MKIFRRMVRKLKEEKHQMDKKLKKSEDERRNRFATSIQSAWRGNRVRKHIKSTIGSLEDGMRKQKSVLRHRNTKTLGNSILYIISCSYRYRRSLNFEFFEKLT